MFDSPARWSPGARVAIVTPSSMALVDGSVTLDSAERTWVALAREPKLSVFLQEFAASTNSSLLDMPDFAVVTFSDDECHVAVRGDFEVEVATSAGSQVLTGEGITTWTERLVTGAQYVRLGSPTVGEGSAPIVSGVITAGALQWGGRASVEESVPALAAELLAEIERDDEPVEAELEAMPEKLEFSLDATPVDEEPLLEEDPQLAETVVSPDAYPTSPTPLSWLVVDGGESVPIEGPIVVGRTPLGTAIKTEEPPTTLVLPYPHVSNNHIAFLVEGDQVFALDLNSSNGSFLIRPGTPATRIPEYPVPLEHGDVIDLGHDVFIRIEGIS